MRRKNKDIDKLKEKAFELYLLDEPIYKIAQKLKISRNTVAKWRDEDEWDKRREVIRENARKKLDQIREEAIAEAYKSLAELEELATTILKSQIDKGKIKFRSLERAIEVLTRIQEAKAHILGLDKQPPDIHAQQTNVHLNLGELLKDLYPLAPVNQDAKKS